MSWQTHALVKVTNTNFSFENVDEQLRKNVAPTVIATPSEVDEQILSVIEAYGALVNAVTNETFNGDVHIAVSGHANPDHLYREGWAADHITVTVIQGESECPR